MNWDPEQYLKYGEARRRPALDLIARLGGVCPNNVVDLGCGAGDVTRLLAEHWPQAKVVGVDNDAAMLRKASSTASQINWQSSDIVEWQPAVAPDLIFSNAVLHWLADHPQLLPSLIAQLAEGGVLAVQMPSNFSSPSHQILRKLADDYRWQQTLGGIAMGKVLSAAEYYRLLSPFCRRVDVWETIYWQALSGDDAIIEWMKGTTLRPYLACLDAVAKEHFLTAYRGLLAVAYPRASDGHTLFPFKRVFFVAQR
ncbi:MAG: Trans-aconitate 2-methyltransferase [Candidatus Accumulibacter appositus]|uniref:Trans-aconitate 2-methyltransferase n=1 Tax=Candidatus Accumulibacter appositus TaxID=1454003 RepID=A0A011QF58_9PROT|nr:methyltransferase domain-containing protein [Accumulibacter sp.]EXI77419.1 MAG: Trans-aconitate 2-methyltransferase [Candidatus Accumulibacter appositus]HRF04791.1 methyltransferase domain-containing protein [Accumulibacter sp.]